MSEDWHKWLTRHGSRIRVYSPATRDQLASAIESVGELPNDLYSLYLVTNGITSDVFTILPVFEPSRPKQTWDSIQRANNPLFTKFVNDSAFLKRFLIFAELQGPGFGAYDRDVGAIWYSDGDELYQLDTDLSEFLTLLMHEEASGP